MNNVMTRIAIFGALEITHGSAAPQRPPTQRVLALLGYLIAHHDVPQARDKLVDLLWPDLLPRQGRRMLSDTLWRARRLLTPPGQLETPALLIAGDTVAFRADASTWVDLIAFEQALAAHGGSVDDTSDQLRAAIELYRGDFLEECYDDWALYERERLREHYLSALQRVLAADQARQAYDLALQSALRLAQADPLREEAHRALMRLYHLLGRTEEALRAFEHCRTLLHTELGIEPEAETSSLYDELRALHQRRSGTSQPAASIDTSILQDVPLVGRAGARAEIMEAIEQALIGTGGLILLAGEAGQGKSRLLREVAAGADWRGAQVSWGRGREDAQALPFGALREALREMLTPVRAHRLAELLPARTLDTLLPLLPELTELLPEQPFHLHDPGEQPVAALHAALASVLLALGQIAPQVVMLEDLHWFDRATLEALATLLPALRGARVLLVVSGRAEELAARQPVWDTLLQLDRSGLMRRLELHGLDEAEVAELVRRALRMQHAAPRFSARLAAATGGNPFFILETLRALHEQGTLRRDEQGVWHTPWDTAGSDYHELPLPAGLRQAIDGRVGKLTQAERTALAAAAVLGQNFSPSVLARMTTDDRRPTTDDQLAPMVGGRSSAVADQLLRRQFLAEDGAGYRFEHELLREVIYDRLDGATRQELHLRAAEALEHEHYARVEALAQHLYLAGAWDKATPYLVQAGDHARLVYAYRDALRCYDQALESATQHSAQAAQAATLWDIQLKRGAVATPLGEYADATAAYSEVLRLAERDQAGPGAQARAGTRRNAQIQALNGLCFIYGQRNDYVQARRVIEAAMHLAAKSPRLIDRAETFYQAGLIHFRQDDYGEARRHMNEALRLYDALDRDAEHAKCLIWLGWTYLRQDGPTDQVIDFFTQALEVYRRHDDRFSEHLCLSDLAGAYLSRGDLREALQATEQCLDFFYSTGALDDALTCLYTRGEIYRRMGRVEEALESLYASLDLCRQLDRSAAANFNQVAIAATLRDLGRYDDASAMLEQPLISEDRRTRARALLVAADSWRAQAQIHKAWACLAEGMALARELGVKPYLGSAYRSLAQLRQADTCGQLPTPSAAMPAAEACLAESMRLLREAHANDELALTCAALGSYLAATHRLAEARAMLIQAQTLIMRCGMTGALEQVRQLLQALPSGTTPLQPGQQRVMLARRGTPRGRPLRPDELIEVIWDVETPAQREVGRAPTKATARQEILLRLCAEASAQDAEPTVGDLAEALGVTPRTIDRDIAALRAAGQVLVTRGGSGKEFNE